jgi:DNA modification methylase
MGNCKTDKVFIEHFGFLCAQLFRVMQSGRNVSIHCMDYPTSVTHDGFIGLRDFPAAITTAMTNAGFVYHSKVIIWKDPVIVMQRTKALGLLYKQLRKDSTRSRQGIPDEVRTFRKPGENSNPVSHNPMDLPLGAEHCPEGWDKRFNWQNYASPVWMDINPSDTLQFRTAREENDERHICPLQLEVIQRCIVLWSNPGDLVLSPFAGIGSEGHVALKMERKFIGVELKEEYFKLACKNLCNAQKDANTPSLFKKVIKRNEA